MVKLKGTAPTPEGEKPELIAQNDVIEARLANVEVRSFEWTNRDTGKLETVTKLRWDFVVIDEGPWKGKTIFGDTSTNFTNHPNCKAFNWVTSLTGRQYAEGEDLDTDDLLSLPCRIMIGHKPDKGGNIWMRAKEVLPARTQVAAAQMPVEDAPF
jgi:hypothetical protein